MNQPTRRKAKPQHSVMLEQQRKQQFDALVASLLAQAPARTPSATHHSASTKGDYSGSDLIAPSVRPGADKFLTFPSRMGNNFVHHCSRTTGHDGNPVSISIGVSK